MALLPVTSQAQGTCVSGYLVEASSQAPLRFAAVQLQRDGAGAVADEHGYFELESTGAWDHDSLVVMTDEVRSVHRVDCGSSQELRLAVVVQRVNRYRAPARPKRTKASPVASPKVPPVRAAWGIPGTCYAFRVRNEAPARRGTLRTASFYIGDDGAIPREHFRVRLYHVTDKGPGAELFPNENVIADAPRSNSWHTIDLSTFHLAIPETGYYVALEFFVTEGSGGPSFRYGLYDYTPTGPFMRPVYEAHERNVWSNPGRTGWTLLPLHNGLFGRYSAMIKLEVAPLK